MKSLRAWALRFAGCFAGKRRDRELAEEIESHLQLHIDDNMRSGMTYEQARRSAVLRLGGVESAKEAYRDRSTFPLLTNILQDARFAVRQLRKNPAFAWTAISMFALGLCACMSVFAFVDAALIKPLPYANPKELVYVTERNATLPRANLSYFDYLDWKQDNKVFRSLDAVSGAGYLFNTAAGAKPIAGMNVSDGFFRTLGIRPIFGRDFYPSDDLPGAPHTALLSYAAWQQFFGGTKTIAGRTIWLSGEPYLVIGVLPQSFHFAPGGNAAVWTPLRVSGYCESRRSCHNLVGIARLKEGVSAHAALANMESIAGQLEQKYPQSNRGQWATVLPLADVFVGDVRPVLLVLLGGGVLLLLISCVDVASLILARSEVQRREIAIRSSVGASTARMFLQFATETAVLVGAGTFAGVFLSVWAMKVLVSLIPADMLAGMPYLLEVKFNAHLFAFAAAIAVLATLIFAAIPGVHLKLSDTAAGLSEGSRGSAGRVWRRLGSKLVVIELAFAMVLLMGAGLLTKSLGRLLHVDLGFQPGHLALMTVSVPDARYNNDEKLVALETKVEAAVTQLPGVKGVGVTNMLPVTSNGNTDWIRFVGRPFKGEHNEVNQRDVSFGYFSTVRAQLVRGRYFTAADDAVHPNVAIVNEALAHKFFPGEDPLGKRYGDTNLTPKSIREIVGVVKDIRDGSLEEEIWPAEYLPYKQSTDDLFSVIAFTAQDEHSVLPAMSASVRRIDSELGIADEMSMSDRIANSPSAYLHRSSAWLVGGFAAMALLLGVTGLYGVVAYSVSQRTREIGIRMALGAQRKNVRRLILGEAGRLTIGGLAIGLVCSLATALSMRKLLFGVSSWDLPTLAVVASVLALASIVACYLPAKRAALVDPVQALRAE